MQLGQIIRLYPNNKQVTYFTQATGVARFAYNWGLAKWNEMYKNNEKPNWKKLDAKLNSSKKEQYPWMYNVTKWATQKSLGDLGDAFKQFFRRVKNKDPKPGYPKFKKKGRCKEQFYVAGRELKFNGENVCVPRLGWVRMAQAIRFPGRVIGSRVSLRAGNWYLSLQIEIDESKYKYPHCCKNQATVVGIDLGLINLVTPSKGKSIPTPRTFRLYEKKLRHLNKELSRRKKFGSNWKKTKLKIQKVNEKVSNIRLGITHKLTTNLIENFRFIGIEDLNIQGILQNKRLAKSISDASLFEIRRQLEYKTILAKNTLIIADRWYPSSKTCSNCGYIYKELQLSQRKWICPKCLTVHDRDFNAAKNLEKLAVGYTVKACGEESSGDFPWGIVKLASLKQESSNSFLLKEYKSWVPHVKY